MKVIVRLIEDEHGSIVGDAAPDRLSGTIEAMKGLAAVMSEGNEYQFHAAQIVVQDGSAHLEIIYA